MGVYFLEYFMKELLYVRQIVIDMQKILMDDTATIVFGHPQTNIVSRKNLDNAEIQACDYYWITKDWKPAK